MKGVGVSIIEGIFKTVKLNASKQLLFLQMPNGKSTDKSRSYHSGDEGLFHHFKVEMYLCTE